MQTYVVNLTNPEDQASTSPLGWSSGRHGYQLRAESIYAAAEAAVANARRDGYYGADWRARIAPTTKHGALSRECWSDRIVDLWDGGDAYGGWADAAPALDRRA